MERITPLDLPRIEERIAQINASGTHRVVRVEGGNLVALGKLRPYAIALTYVVEPVNA